MTVNEILKVAKSIRDQLAAIAAAVDLHSSELTDMRDRAALYRLGRVAHDAANALRNEVSKWTAYKAAVRLTIHDEMR